MHIKENKIVIITEPKIFNIRLTKDVDNNLKYEIDSVIIKQSVFSWVYNKKGD